MVTNAEIIRYLKSALSFLKGSEKSPYFVKIYDVYQTTEMGLVVKYHIENTRITDSIPIDEFIKTPLLYGVHPRQLYLIGYDNGIYNERIKIQQEHQVKGTFLSRFRRVFYGNLH